MEIVALLELNVLQLFEKRQIFRFRVCVAPVDDVDRDLFVVNALEIFLVVRGQADVGRDYEDLLLHVLDDIDESCTHPRCVEEICHSVAPDGILLSEDQARELLGLVLNSFHLERDNEPQERDPGLEVVHAGDVPDLGR